MKTNFGDKALGFLGTLGIIGILVAGCAATEAPKEDKPAAPAPPPPEFFQQKYQKLEDGRIITCLYKEGHISGYSGGTTPAMSCDWDHPFAH